MTRIKSYSDLIDRVTFEERFEYLKFGGSVGYATFGFDRYLNQAFYRSVMWKRAREIVIIRDNGCDLGITGREIFNDILIHHMNPIVADDIVNGEEWLIDPEYLITTTKRTHNAIHYGVDLQHPPVVVTREQGDTTLW